jgi:biotin carboxyl carrier protein
VSRTFTLTLDGTEYEVKQQGQALFLNGKRFKPEISGNTITIEDTPHTVELDGSRAIFDGIAFPFTTEGLEEKKSSVAGIGGAAEAGDGAVMAIMPGLIINVAVSEGDTVATGDVLVILEAMKMESEICSPVNGVVKEVHVKAGDNVAQSQPLIVVEEPEGSEA